MCDSTREKHTAHKIDKRIINKAKLEGNKCIICWIAVTVCTVSVEFVFVAFCTAIMHDHHFAVCLFDILQFSLFNSYILMWKQRKGHKYTHKHTYSHCMNRMLLIRDYHPAMT